MRQIFCLIAAMAAAFAVAQPAVSQADLSGGMNLLQRGEIDQALALFHKARSLHPRDPAAPNAIGAALCLKNQTEEAMKYFQAALRINPEFSPAVKNLALAEFNLGRYNDSALRWRMLLKVPSARPQANLFLGMIAAVERRDGDAVQHFDSAGELTGAPPKALVSFARSLARTGDSSRALEIVAGLRKRSDVAPAERFEIVAILSELNLFADALDELGAVEQTGAGSSSDRLRLELLARSGRAEDAIAIANQLLERAPDAGLYSQLARIAERAGKLDQAVEALRTAIRRDPDSEDHYLDLSLLCARYRNSALALEIVELGLKRMPHSYRLLVQKGIALEYSDKHDQAIEAFRQAIALEDDHTVALGALAVSQILYDQLEDAINTLKAGVARFPADYYLHYLFGYALDRSRAAQGDDEKLIDTALVQLETAIRLNPSSSQAHYCLGRLLLKRDKAAASRNFETAIRLDPNAHAAKYQLGRLYLELGKTEAGNRLLEQVSKAKADQLELEQKPAFVVVKQ